MGKPYKLHSYILNRNSKKAVKKVFKLNKKYSWSKKNGIYIGEQHGKTNECYKDLKEAKSKCEAANVCGGKYRVTHGGPTQHKYGNWKPYKLHSYILNRNSKKAVKKVFKLNKKYSW